MFLPLSIRTTLSCLWNALSRNGMAPHKSIEQLSYLLVLKLLEIDASVGSLASQPAAARWSTLRAMPEERLLQAVDEAMAWLRTSDFSESQLFHTAAVFFSKPSLLRDAMDLVDTLFSAAQPGEIRAHIYDALLLMAEKE